jgi:hypothetical protein
MFIQLIFIFFLFIYFQKIYDFLKIVFLWIKFLINTDRNILKLLLLSYILIIKQKINTKVNSFKQSFKQKWYSGIEVIGDNRYLLKHFIDGEKVYIIVKKNKNKIIGVYDKNYDTCLTEEVLPFLKIKQDTLYSQDFNISEPLFIVFENDSREEITSLKNNI